MTETTDNLYLRTNLACTGEVPREGSTTQSPDIIPYDSEFVPDFETFFATQESYETDPGRQIVAEEENYVYVRAKNLYSGGAAEGEVHLYWARSGTAWETDQWTAIDAVSGPADPIDPDAGVPAPIAADETDEIVVASSAFLWTAPELPDGYHYCLIARIVTSTPDDPNPIPAFTSSGEWHDWVRTNLQIAQRNTSFVEPSDEPYQLVQDIANVGDQTEQFVIAVHCDGLPVGSTVVMTCAAAEPQPPIDVHGAITDSSETFDTPLTTLPPHYQAAVLVTVTMPEGASFPDGAEVVVTQNAVADGTDELLARYAVTPQSLGLRPLPEGHGVVRLGSVRWEFRE